jgi:hypothetical protein
MERGVPASPPGARAVADSQARPVFQLPAAGGVVTTKRYKFQALLTLGPAADGGQTAVPVGQVRRMLVWGRRHETHAGQFFTGLVANNGDGSDWLGRDHLIVTVVVTGDDVGQYFDIGDHFALWHGGDIASGVVSRRLFI